MNDNYTPTEQLIRFMDGDMSGDEVATLELELAGDPARQMELENLRNSRMAVSRLGLQMQVASIHAEMMNELKATEKDNVRQLSPVRKITQFTLRIAVGLFILVVAGGLYQYFSLSPDKLFNDKYAAFNVGTSRGNTQQSQVETEYAKKKYEQVIITFESIQNPTLKDHFYAGLAYLSTSNLDKAVLNLSTVLTKNASFNTSEFQDDAEYYLALSYLKQQDFDKAVPLFEKINADKLHLYHDKVGNWFLKEVKIARWKK